MSRYDLTDFEWRVIEPLLPNKPRGVPRVDDRRVLNGIFWVLRSGAPWRDLPERYGPRSYRGMARLGGSFGFLLRNGGFYQRFLVDLGGVGGSCSSSLAMVSRIGRSSGSRGYRSSANFRRA